MKLLIVDNYDSFTFNLYQLVAEVLDTLPVVLRNDSSWEEIAEQSFDAAIISPGPGTPERETDFGISRRIISETAIPILGVCLGHQGICYAAGTPIVHAPEPAHGRVSQIHHRGDGLFAGIPTPFPAVRYHSLVVPDSLPECLETTAWTQDGLVMAVAHKSRPHWGVQFHPESICTLHGRQLIENFLKLASEAQPGWRRVSSAVAAPGAAGVTEAAETKTRPRP